jgi:hypothetical protein
MLAVAAVVVVVVTASPVTTAATTRETAVTMIVTFTFAPFSPKTVFQYSNFTRSGSQSNSKYEFCAMCFRKCAQHDASGAILTASAVI